ncbi:MULTISPECIES: porin [unclassified Undibacterium]|uniref:porin n=1 Tax=unclassified Undibacterium TaxID=2630295 RepID=UPI002AC9C04D|nr:MULTISPECIES: porin [unclassified Undibacterium]MEB0137931.1 porin [Undibacterium sp. CCC2.1]MEB0172051.1 porin [Undibacterium sp. CCC1.1]MEB0174939.1 porin [Undibacterium sp. CCC3.4]MEB0214853.1 porin [Undibacterium sp. 5I2]WPX45383.1 porin [Undibacterium sp. CCC3.4]
MKKSFLALALISAFSGAAFAQSSVTIYGIADAGVQGLSTGSGKVFSLQSGQENGSRLGFKGTEDLGNGLKANFVLEQGINIDTGASGQSATFGRRATVGLSSDFGTVDLGRDKSPTFKFFDNFDPFASGFINSGNGLSGIYTIGGNATTTGVTSTSRGRVTNSVFYATPNTLSGFTALGQYGFGEAAGDNSNGRSLGVNLGYKIEGLELGYSYLKDNATSAALVTNGKKANTVAATYDFGVAKPVVIYQKSTDDLGLSKKTYTLGVTVPVTTAGKVLATFTNVKNDTAFGTKGATVGSAKQFAVGYQYALSKRTDLYTAYARTNQDANSAGFEGLKSSLGANINEVTAGVRHQF